MSICPNVKHPSSSTHPNLDQSLATEYDNRLQESLKDLRKHYDKEAAALKAQLEKMYVAKISGMQDQLNRNQSENQGMQEEISTSKLKIGGLTSQLNSMTVRVHDWCAGSWGCGDGMTWGGTLCVLNVLTEMTGTFDETYPERWLISNDKCR